MLKKEYCCSCIREGLFSSLLIGLRRLMIVLICVIITVSCATTSDSSLLYDSPEFAQRPEIIVINGKRFLSYQLGGVMRSTQPIIRSKVVNGEVLCFASGCISANAKTDLPRKDRISDKGPVFWVNPDGSRIELNDR